MIAFSEFAQITARLLERTGVVGSVHRPHPARTHTASRQRSVMIIYWWYTRKSEVGPSSSPSCATAARGGAAPGGRCRAARFGAGTVSSQPVRVDLWRTHDSSYVQRTFLDVRRCSVTLRRLECGGVVSRGRVCVPDARDHHVLGIVDDGAADWAVRPAVKLGTRKSRFTQPPTSCLMPLCVYFLFPVSKS
jgi:hypothetical protein